MRHDTHTLRHVRCAVQCTGQEHAEAAAMVARLREIITRSGTYQPTLCELSRRLAGTRYAVTRRTLVRWMNGYAAPLTVDPVEALARAAGVDIAYLSEEVAA